MSLVQPLTLMATKIITRFISTHKELLLFNEFNASGISQRRTDLKSFLPTLLFFETFIIIIINWFHIIQFSLQFLNLPYSAGIVE